MSINKIIGGSIRKRRKELNISQEQLAEKLGYSSKAAISRIENGHNAFPMDRLPEFAEVLSIDPFELLGYDLPSRAFMDTVEKQIIESDRKLQSELLDSYNKLNTAGRKEANKRVAEMTEIPKYTEGE